MQNYENQTGDKDREMVLPPNTSCQILDKTKGAIITYVGPKKETVSTTDQPVIFDKDQKKFVHVTLDMAISTFPVAPEGWYMILKNPSIDRKQPNINSASTLGDNQLHVGRKVNLHGPITFPLWPGQMAKVIQGHHLRSNQYLIVRVYDEIAAEENWTKAVITQQPKTDSGTDETDDKKKKDDKNTVDKSVEKITADTDIPDLTMGKLMIVKGTDVSFYMPPTGIEVVEFEGKYVQNAVTLERLWLCILLDENGTKDYKRGPDVVFPKPTQQFIVKKGQRKFRALELSPISGIHAKATVDFNYLNKDVKEGEELWITGVTCPIYYPREELGIIKYSDTEIHYATAIPKGEGRYVMNRLSADIVTRPGPEMLLLDPRKEVLIRRILSDEEVRINYPGNDEALEYNRHLRGMMDEDNDLGYIDERSYQDRSSRVRETTMSYSTLAEHDIVEDSMKSLSPRAKYRGIKSPFEQEREEMFSLSASGSGQKISNSKKADLNKFSRKTKFTQPRTVTLNTKYEGTVRIEPWTGYAIKVISKTDNAQVIIGPKSTQLDYHESLEAMALSTGTPKNSDSTIKTGYLRILNNKVSDIINAETELGIVTIHLSYTVNFVDDMEGGKDKWFNVENYIQFLCDRVRSMIGNEAKQHGIQHFYNNAISIVRELILGEKDEETGQRKGYAFPENNMRIVEVEVQSVDIKNHNIGDMLDQAQSEIFSNKLQIEGQKRKLAFTKELGATQQQINDVQHTTALNVLTHEKEVHEANVDVTLAELQISIDAITLQKKASLDLQPILDEIQTKEIGRQVKEYNQEKIEEDDTAKRDEYILKSKVDAFVKKIGAVSPSLISTLNKMSDKDLAKTMAESFNIQSMVGGNSIVDVARKVLGEAVDKKSFEFKSYDDEDNN